MAALHVVVVTGLSGAGRSTALNALEDLGFFCVDNLPPALAEQLCARLASEGQIGKLGLGIDVRTGAFLVGADDVLSRLLLSSVDGAASLEPLDLTRLLDRLDADNAIDPLRRIAVLQSIASVLHTRGDFEPALRALFRRALPRHQFSRCGRSCTDEAGFASPVVGFTRWDPVAPAPSSGSQPSNGTAPARIESCTC